MTSVNPTVKAGTKKQPATHYESPTAGLVMKKDTTFGRAANKKQWATLHELPTAGLGLGYKKDALSQNRITKQDGIHQVLFHFHADICSRSSIKYCPISSGTSTATNS